MKKYWKEVLFFSVVSAYFLYGLAPDMTWMSIGADQINYVVAALYNAPAGLSGNPLYILLGSLLVRLPGNDFWNLGLLSALPAIGTCIVIFLTVKKLTDNKLTPYIASLVFASAFPVWAESIVAETYMIAALTSSLVIYFCLTKHYYWMAAMIALGVGLHPLGIWIAGPCLVFAWWQESRDYKLVGKIVGITVLGFVFRLRDVFTEPATTNLFFLQNPYQNLLYSAGGYFGNTVIPIQPTLQRLWEDFAAMGGSLWAVVLAGFTFTRRKEATLLWAIFGLAVFFPFSSLYPQWIKYFFLPVLPLSILVGLGVGRLKLKYSYLLVIPSLVLMVLNVSTYSPGKTIDPVPTTARQFYEALDSVPDSSVIVGHTWGHPDLVIGYYSVEANDRFDYVNFDSLVGGMAAREYASYQETKGINLPNYLQEDNISVREFALELQELNPDRKVYVTYVRSSKIPMEFNLVSASKYRAELNNVPVDKIQFVR